MGALDTLAADISKARTGNPPLWLYLVTDSRRTRRTNVAAHTTEAAKQDGAARLELPLSEVVTTRVRLFGTGA